VAHSLTYNITAVSIFINSCPCHPAVERLSIQWHQYYFQQFFVRRYSPACFCLSCWDHACMFSVSIQYCMFQSQCFRLNSRSCTFQDQVNTCMFLFRFKIMHWFILRQLHPLLCHLE